MVFVLNLQYFIELKLNTINKNIVRNIFIRKKKLVTTLMLGFSKSHDHSSVTFRVVPYGIL